MSRPLAFSCTCGALTGVLHDADAAHTCHLVCYCRDCRAFVRHLNRLDDLAPGGGVPLIQAAPSRLEITQGAEHIACKSLTEKGLLRWYAACCDTPLANTPRTARMPFAGIWRPLFADPAPFGPPVALGFVKSALPGGGAPTQDKGLLRMLAGVVRRMAGAYLNGTARKNPFFTPDGTPVAVPQILTPEQRKASFDH